MLENHRQKVDQMAEELAALQAALASIREIPPDAEALSARLEETPIQALPIPPADIHPRYKQLDELYHYIDEQLPPLSRQILRLRYQQGLKYREIADELKVSEVTVYQHLSQSLKQMKEHFNTKGYGI